MKNPKKYKVIWTICLAAWIIIYTGGLSHVQAAHKGFIYVLTVNGPINPAIAEFVIENVEKAAQDKAHCLIIQLDTPGGLDLSMRSIVKSILNSEIPVIVYVSPSGARAASAGVMITLAADIAAMAPGTNIGAAHPVTLGQEMDKEMMRKVENDMVAYVKSIASKRRRNVQWAEKAVRKSVSITENEALNLMVIDLIARDLNELIQRIDGWEIKRNGKEVLSTRETSIVFLEENLRHRILRTLSDPNIAYVLMMIGMTGLFFELAHPGAIFPGVIGGICLILAFFAFQTLPINYAGILLIILSIILFILEVKVTSFGLLGIAGIICLILGSLMLFRVPSYMGVSWKTVIPTVGAISLFFLIIGTLAFKAYVSKPKTGMEGLIGAQGVATKRIVGEGKVFVHGEYWNAESEEVIESGEKIEVIGSEHLRLKVKKIKNK
ncbi:MAG TPA: nodulation protein NfeD [Syntrophaceae bacterium]|nr:nodulation protein NfeD [Syntrophaceae bacterium]